MKVYKFNLIKDRENSRWIDLDEMTNYDSNLEIFADFVYCFDKNPEPLFFIWRQKAYSEIKDILRRLRLSKFEISVLRIYEREESPNYTFNTIWNFLL